MTEPSPGPGAPRHRRDRKEPRCPGTSGSGCGCPGRDLRDLPPPECAVRVDAGLHVPAADGVPLITDHYIPQVDSPRPTVLVRTPYGRGFPWDHLFGGLVAERGFHVVIQSCRGTGGSGGEYQPFTREQGDGLATVAWLREQDWFTGVLATIGPSYLSSVQWALATDPPPELRAMVTQNGVSDPYSVIWPGGAFALENMLVATAATLGFQRGMGALIRTGLRVQRHMRRVGRQLPLIDAYPPALGTRVSYVDEWLRAPDRADPYWTSLEIGADRPVPPVPASLLTGWWDACLDQVLERYRQLRDSGTPARLVVGPWTHASGFNQGLPVVLGEALSWLRAYTADAQAPEPIPNENLPVRVHVGGAGEWRDLADWPPPELTRQPWYLGAEGRLVSEPPELQDPAQPGVSSFRYDPADPTPSLGGQLFTGKAGAVDNRALEARPDVLVFTSAPLTVPLDVIGPVSVRAGVRASGAAFDLFARLCDVDPRGRSRNVCDGIIRCDAAGAGPETVTPVTVPMSATAYQFRAGHRLRLQVSGGAHPRFARNTGSGEPPATATRLVPVDVQIRHEAADPAVLSLPVMPRRSDPGGRNGTLGHQQTSRSPDVNARAEARSRTDL